jgi:hypothetical protein
MADAGAIRAGGAYIEITADNAKLAAGLKTAEDRLRAWTAQQSANMKAIGGPETNETGISGKWLQSIARGDRCRRSLPLSGAN